MALAVTNAPSPMMAGPSTPVQAPHAPPRSLEFDDRGRSRFHGCSGIKHYELMSKLGEGTFGEVYKARSRKNGSIVALKKILVHNEKDGFPITALREIKLLKMLSHVNVLKLEEMAVERSKGEGRKKATMYMVTPYMDHDLSGLLENPDVHFTEPQIKCYLLQLLKGLKYLHDNQILHRDMKAANLLINNQGILQIADFGLARHFDEAPPQPGKGNGEAKRDYTSLVVTRWYRPPELLLQLRRYTPAIDMWGVGCVFGEMFVRKPILAGSSDLNQIQMIFDLVGSPTEDNMPGWSLLPGCEGVKDFKSRPSTLAQRFREQGPLVISLLSELLKLDWRKRINAADALNHPYFRSEPLPAKPGDLPRFEDSHELDRRRFRGQKAALPPAPAGGTVGMGPTGEWSNGPPNHRRDMPGNGYANDHRRDRGWAARDQPARNGRDQRDSGRVPPRHGDDRRPAWAKEHHHPSLPPRPTHVGWGPENGGGGGNRGRGPPPHSHRDGKDSRMDSYVPDYSGDASRHRGPGGGPGDRHERNRVPDDRHPRDRDRDWRRRSRSRSPRPIERDRDKIREREREIYRR